MKLINRWRLFSVGLLLAPSLAQAAQGQSASGQVDFAPANAGLTSYVENFYNWSIGAGIVAAILMLMYAGYMMVTSAGEPERIGFAKEVIVGSLTGLALLAAARLVLNVLSVTP